MKFVPKTVSFVFQSALTIQFVLLTSLVICLSNIAQKSSAPTERNQPSIRVLARPAAIVPTRLFAMLQRDSLEFAALCVCQEVQLLPTRVVLVRKGGSGFKTNVESNAPRGCYGAKTVGVRWTIPNRHPSTGNVHQTARFVPSAPSIGYERRLMHHALFHVGRCFPSPSDWKR